MSELWDAARGRLPPPREDRPHQPVYAITEPPAPGDTGLRAATRDDLERLIPACAAAHELELHIDPLARDPEAFRWRTEAQIDEGRSWLWIEDDVDPLQGGGLVVDAIGGPAPAGLGRPGGPRPGLRRPRPARPRAAPARVTPDGDALRPRRERTRDRHSTSRSACGRCSSTGASCFEAAPAFARPFYGLRAGSPGELAAYLGPPSALARPVHPWIRPIRRGWMPRSRTRDGGRLRPHR